MKTLLLSARLIFVLFTFIKPLTSFALNAQEEFEKIKSLQGVWIPEIQSSETQEISYEVVSGGSSVIEKADGMLTVFHLDANNIMATHYCIAQNQPRLIASNFNEDNILNFVLKDGTNLETTEGYISQIKFKFIESNKFQATWVWKDNINSKYTEHSKLYKRKSNLNY